MQSIGSEHEAGEALIKILAFHVCFCLIWWAYLGYLFFLASKKAEERTWGAPDPTADRPTIAVLVPCLNEAHWIKKKIDNLSSLRYPADKVVFVLVDGGSEDDTQSIIREQIREKPNWRLIVSDRKGKIPQLNTALRNTAADVVLSTDVDATLSEDTLWKMADIMGQGPDIGVVGALVHPRTSFPWERLHWQQQNRIRLMESSFHSASVVIAACYAYRRKLIDQFPESVVADDVYVPMVAGRNGYKTIYSDAIMAFEERTPEDFRSFMRHKFRKTHANLIETLRFFPALPTLVFPWNIIYGTRMLQLLLLPWASLLYLLLMISVPGLLWFHAPVHLAITAMSVGLLAGKTKQVEVGGKITISGTHIWLLLFLNLQLMISHLAFPFYRQTSSYEKIDG